MKEVIVEAHDLKKYFTVKLGFLKKLLSKEVPIVHAVDGVDLKVRSKEIVGLVGESGCGKTTTGKLLLRLIEPTQGKILFQGQDITSLSFNEMRKLRRKMQIIFQDPYESLSPRMSIYDIIAEPLRILKITKDIDEEFERIVRILRDVGLVPPKEFLYKFPHEVSGGQRQRVAIARAFVLEPKFLVADEPVSMLDASIRNEILKLMLRLVEKVHCAFLYITHDIALSSHLCDRLAVMYLGKIVEKGRTYDLIRNPAHPYTRALLAAVPIPDPAIRQTKIPIKGQIPSPLNPPSGCRFHPRCPYARNKCRIQEPQLEAINRERYVACHFPLA